jgi:hypothetical protein
MFLARVRDEYDPVGADFHQLVLTLANKDYRRLFLEGATPAMRGTGLVLQHRCRLGTNSTLQDIQWH